MSPVLYYAHSMYQIVRLTSTNVSDPLISVKCKTVSPLTFVHTTPIFFLFLPVNKTSFILFPSSHPYSIPLRFGFIKVWPQQGSHLSLSIAHYKATNHIALFHSAYLFMLHKNYPPSVLTRSGGANIGRTKKFQIQSDSGDPQCNTHTPIKKKKSVRECVPHAFADHHGYVQRPARDPPGVPWRAGADRQSGGALQCLTLTLEEQQEFTHRV